MKKPILLTVIIGLTCLGGDLKATYRANNPEDNVIKINDISSFNKIASCAESEEILNLDLSGLKGWNNDMILLLAKFSKLRTLSLSGNKMGDLGAKLVADFLRGNGTLKVLHISENNIGDVGAKYIAECLQVNTSLQDLWLGINSIGCEGAKYIARSLYSNEALKLLSLSFNYIWIQGEEAFRNALENNHTLQVLDLWGNNIDGDSFLKTQFPNRVKL